MVLPPTNPASPRVGGGEEGGGGTVTYIRYTNKYGKPHRVWFLSRGFGVKMLIDCKDLAKV